MKPASSRNPICSELTGRAPSGIAVVLLQGQGADEILSRTFRRSSSKGLPAADEAAHGMIWSEGRPLDEVIVIRMESPPSEGFEICCHGGRTASRILIDAFVRHGAVERPWTKLVPEGTLEYDLLKALLAAEGEGQALALARLMSGQLRAAFLRIGGALENGVPETRKDGLLRGMRALLESHGHGRMLSEPPLVVITGPPNAGKSTLFNAVLGESRALTSSFPGTTRDPVEALFLLEGFPVRLADTPGRATEEHDSLTAECVSAAGRLAAKASLEIRLADEDPDSPPCRSQPAFDRVCGCEVIHVLSKSDLPGRGCEHPLRKQLLFLSALRGTGVKRLLQLMSVRLGISKLRKRTGPILMTDHQARLVEAAIEIVSTGKNRPEVLESLRGYLRLARWQEK